MTAIMSVSFVLFQIAITAFSNFGWLKWVTYQHVLGFLPGFRVEAQHPQLWVGRQVLPGCWRLRMS